MEVEGETKPGSVNEAAIEGCDQNDCQDTKSSV